MSDLEDKLEDVCDEATFIRFLAALGEDEAAGEMKKNVTPSGGYQATTNGWEHSMISAFLEASAASAAALLKSGRREDGQSPWRICAEILYAGKYYE